MKEHIKVDGVYRDSNYLYKYESVSLAKHNVAMYRDYMPYIKSMLQFALDGALDGKLNISPNYARKFIVKFSVPSGIHYYLEHPSSYLDNMEKGDTPPRHIWDKNFPGSMGFVTTIYHKVARRSRYRRQLSDILGTWESYTITGSTIAADSSTFVSTDEMIERYTSYVDALSEDTSGTGS